MTPSPGRLSAAELAGPPTPCAIKCRAAPCRCAVGAVGAADGACNLCTGTSQGAVPTPRRPLSQSTPAPSLGPLAPRPMAALICCLPQRLLLGQEAILLASGTEKAYYPARKYKPCSRGLVQVRSASTGTRACSYCRSPSRYRGRVVAEGWAKSILTFYGA